MTIKYMALFTAFNTGQLHLPSKSRLVSTSKLFTELFCAYALRISVYISCLAVRYLSLYDISYVVIYVEID